MRPPYALNLPSAGVHAMAPRECRAAVLAG